MRSNSTPIKDALEYDPETETYRVTYSHETALPSRVVVEAIGAIENEDIDDLSPPLYEAIDPKALNMIFHPTISGDYRGDGEVTFTYQGYEIAVRSYGIIELQPRDQQPAPTAASERNGEASASSETETDTSTSNVWEVISRWLRQ